MKNFVRYFFIITLAFIIFMPLSEAKTKKNDLPTIKYNGVKYYLKYSTLSSSLSSITNEYYKKAEGYATWSELLAVHLFSDENSAENYANELKHQLELSKIPADIDIDLDNKCVVLSFIMVNDQKLPILIESNVIKYTKQGDNVVALQYSKRYRAANPLMVDVIVKNINKSTPNSVKSVKKVKIPPVINAEINYDNNDSNITDKNTSDNIQNPNEGILYQKGVNIN